jgi:hypothetical protein
MPLEADVMAFGLPTRPELTAACSSERPAKHFKMIMNAYRSQRLTVIGIQQ